MNGYQPKVLAVDDDPIWLEQIPLILEEIAEVKCFDTIDKGLMALKEHFFDAAILDINFKGDERTGMDIFKQISALDREMDTVVISGETDPQRLIHIMNAGVTKFLPKPASPDEISRTIRTLLKRKDLKRRAINKEFDNSGCNVIGSSIEAQKLREEVYRTVESGVSDILLIGETGVGKEVFAKTIAALSGREDRFFPINCGAITDSLAESELFGHVKGAYTGAIQDRASAFEIANGGFVFFDEIGEMPLKQQVKLLRVIQERKVQKVGATKAIDVNFKSISATNIDIKQAIKEGSFREDLYYRIAKCVIEIPPLRNRPRDIPEFIFFFLSKKNKQNIDITDSAMSLLYNYRWPGNIRQLEAVVYQLAALAKKDVIREKEVYKAIPELSMKPHISLKSGFLGNVGAVFVQKETKRYREAIVRAGGNRTKAAEILNVSRATFFRRAKELGLTKNRQEIQRH